MADYVFDWSIAAAWVQALGSIAAIWAAGHIIVRAARYARLERLDGIHGIIGFCARAARDAAEAARKAPADPRPLLDFPPERLEHGEAMIETAMKELVIIGSERLPGLLSEAFEAVRSSAQALMRAQSAGGAAAAVQALDAHAASLVRIREAVAVFVDRQRQQVRRWWWQ
jgi:hypothetical protein